MAAAEVESLRGDLASKAQVAAISRDYAVQPRLGTFSETIAAFLAELTGYPLSRKALSRFSAGLTDTIDVVQTIAPLAESVAPWSL